MGSLRKLLVPFVTAVAGGLGLLLGPAGGFVAKAGLGLLISGGLGVASGLLTSSGGRGFSSSPTYRLGGALANHRGDGEPIPAVFGEVQMTPMAVSTIIDTDTDSDILERVYVLGWGPMQVFDTDATDDDVTDLLTRITINDLDLLDVDPTAYATVYETTATGIMPGFSRRGKPYPQAPTKLDKDVQHTYEMKDSADEIHVVFDWLGGLLKTTSSGDATESAGGVLFEYRVADSTGSWLPMDLGGEAKKVDVPKLFDKTGKVVYSYPQIVIEKSKDNPDWVPVVPADNITNVVAGRYFVVGKTRSHVRKVARFRFPAAGRYEIRLTGIVDDDLNDVRAPSVGTIVEVTDGQVTTEAGVTLLGVKIKASEQLRGSEPVLKIKAKGMKVKALEDGGTVQWTDNGVSVLREVLRNTKFGLGLWTTDADIPDGAGEEWRTLAANLDAGTFSVTPSPAGKAITETLGRCNLVMDTRGSARDWINQVLATFRGALWWAEGQYHVARDEARASTRTFEARPNQTGRYNVATVSNQDRRPSLEVAEIPQSERYNRVVIRYLDKDDGWNLRTVEEDASTAVGVTVPVNKLELQLVGITSRAQALYEAKYLVEKFAQSRWMATWDTGWGDLDLTPLDRVTVNAEYPEWSGDTKDFTVLGISYGMDGRGTVTGWEYADVFTQTPTTTPANTGTGKKSTGTPLWRVKRPKLPKYKLNPMFSGLTVSELTVKVVGKG